MTTSVQQAFVVFEIGSSSYAIPSELVERLEILEKVTPVPNAPPGVEGIVSSRGEMIPVVSVRTRLGLEPAPIGVRTRLIVVRWKGRTLGLIVDSAREFIRLPKQSELPPPAALGGADRTFVEAVAQSGDRLILLMNLERLLGEKPGGDPDAKEH